MEINDRRNISCAGVIHSNGCNSETYTPTIFLHKIGSINTRLWGYHHKTLPGMNKKVSYHVPPKTFKILPVTSHIKISGTASSKSRHL
jgi:hypothetical protein